MEKLCLLGSALLLAALSVFADGGVQPKPLLEPALPGAAAQLRPNANCDAQLTTAFEGDAMLLTIAPGESPWPGVFIVPAGGAPSWDLSLWGHVEAKVTNLGAKQVALTLRADNRHVAGKSPWNAEMARVNPGQTVTVRVYFGYHWGFQRGYELDTTAVIGLLLYLGTVEGEPVKLRIEGVQAAGWTGERPGANPDQARVKPQVAKPVPVAVPAAGGNADPKPVVALRPHAGGFWDLSDSIQAVVRIRNTGAVPIAPHERGRPDRMVRAFGARRPWCRGRNPHPFRSRAPLDRPDRPRAGGRSQERQVGPSSRYRHSLPRPQGAHTGGPSRRRGAGL